MPGIIVLGEVDDGQMQPVTAELLAAGRRLQKILGCDVGAALLGAKVGDASASAFSYGADVVYAVEDPLLGEPSADAVVAALHEVCRRVEPDVVLVGRSEVGRDVGPRLAFRLGVGVAQDCIDIVADPETMRVVATRPTYGGNALARVTFPGSGSTGRGRPTQGFRAAGAGSPTVMARW